MTIGIDLSPLQGGHRMRGVGSVVINLINGLPEKVKVNHKIIFYMEPDEETSQNALSLLHLHGLNYTVREKPPRQPPIAFKLPGRLNLFIKIGNGFLTWVRSRSGVRGYDFSDLDVYLLTDQMQIMPRMSGVKKIMIAYDLIPYILEWDYLLSYRAARRRGKSLKFAIFAWLRRFAYISRVKANSRNADKIIAISNQTREDFIKFVGVPKNKIDIVHLGITTPTTLAVQEPTTRYEDAVWDYVRKSYQFESKIPFILFIGGTDARRKLDDLVAAFNFLRAQGHELKLVLSGDILQGPGNLPVKASRAALVNSSYAKDIIYLGFTDESVKNWLYKHALAFIYPSKYEGFGLPILEAMSHGCPVICYKNSSIPEVAGEAALFASNYRDIGLAVEKLLKNPETCKNYSRLGKDQALKFSWEKTAKSIFKLADSISKSSESLG